MPACHAAPTLSVAVSRIVCMTTSDTPLVARVAVDVSLPHLDRLFDYLIPERFRADAVVGARVRVRFAGKLRDGFIVELGVESDFPKLAEVERVTSPEVVLPPVTVALVRAVADHYGGVFADVARLAVPPRHARTEAADQPTLPAPAEGPGAQVLADYPHGSAWWDAQRSGASVRAAWTPAPAADDVGVWVRGFVEAAGATLASGRSALLLVPDADALGQLEAACERAFGAGSFVTLTAELGPAPRYRAFLAAARGAARLVIGTRAAAFTPMPDLGLIAVWDEGNDLYAERRAPYPHTRVVAALRASIEKCGLLLAGPSRTAEVQAWVERSWLVSLALPPGDMRRRGPLVRVAADRDEALERDPAARASRLPHDVFTVIRAGLAAGPVLLQVPRAGYVPAVACRRCGERATCRACGHPLRGEAGASGVRLVCPVCGPLGDGWACAVCGSTEMRAPRVGVARTAEELGKAFPQTRLVRSWSGHRVDGVGAEPALVLATPGAEPRAEGGYAAAILMDADVLLGRPDLRAAEEALRRWMVVAAMVRSGADGGTVMVVGDPSARAIQALVRLDPVGFAERELADRREARFPPAATMVVLDGPPAAVEQFEAAWRGVPGVEHFGPLLAGGESARLTVRVPPARASELLDALRAVQAARSARKDPDVVRLRVDPQEID